MRKAPLTLLLSVALLSSCGGGNTPASSSSSVPTSKEPAVLKTISKAEYKNKTLGGLLGQMAGFLSGYEFVWDGPSPRLALPESWYQFCYGPYAGNFAHYNPGSPQTYNRLKNTGLKGEKEVSSDDDYHLDIFAQTVIDEYGYSSKAITDAWYEYKVFDWGGGNDAMALINKNKMLAPFTGSIESGNRYGWCTESYIENETLGMDAGGMPDVAVNLTDTFASNVGYYDSVVWAKFYAACYAMAYFESDVWTIMEKAKVAMPSCSWPRQMYELAVASYKAHPNDRAAAAEEVANYRRNLFRLDNIQCDPSVNGAFAVLSWLYGKNSYMDSCKWASLMGYDGDCTAATVTGLLGIIDGFKETNPEYQTINDSFYHYGEGTYYNDQGYTCHIGNVEKYGLHIKIDDIVDLYVKNFEKILLENGGRVEGENYLVPVSGLTPDKSISFANCDAEKRDLSDWEISSGTLTCEEDTNLDNAHAGSFGFKFVNLGESSVYHRFNGLKVGSYYRISTYAKANANSIVHMFAKDSNGDETKMAFANGTALINRDMTFKATASSVDVGFRFGLGSKVDDVLYFDDFFVEEVTYNLLGNIEATSLVTATNSYTKALSKPEGYIEGQEVVLRITYAQKTGGSLNLGVLRNNEEFGTVIASNTGYSLNALSDVLEIPYVFSSNATDYLKLTFDGYKVCFGNIDIVSKVSYLFR